MKALYTLPSRHPYFVIAWVYLLILISYVVVRPSIHSCIAGGPNMYACSSVFSFMDILFFFSPLSFFLVLGIFGATLLRIMRAIRLKELWLGGGDFWLFLMSGISVILFFYAPLVWSVGPGLGFSN